nr:MULTISPECIES: NAD(P)-dependent oxidoreductase [unclassified Iodidimonas]
MISVDPDHQQSNGDFMTHKLTFLGLGVMGYPMASHLARKGYPLTVYNRTASRAEHWLAEQKRDMPDALVCTAPTPAEAVRDADIVFACVGNDDDVRAICTGDQGSFAAMRAGALFVDHTTASALVAKDMHQAAKGFGLGFIDAPVSGGEAGARDGRLTVMCGGDAGDFEKAMPVMESYAKMVRLLGSVGAGQTAKMVNQICIAGTLQGLSEALNFCMEAGLDAGQVVEVISQGAAQSWQMEHRAETMIEGRFDFGFAVDWMRKDLAIVLAEARRMGVSLPLTALVDQFYADVQAQGGGRNDTSSLIRRLRRSEQ